MTEVIGLDIETTMKSEVGNKASPYCPDNEIVFIGKARSNGTMLLGLRLPAIGSSAGGFGQPVTYALHNMAFDLTWMHTREHINLYELIYQCDFWDTQIGHYLLTGQEKKFSRLADLAEEYEVPSKGDILQHYIDLGYCIKDIPRHELEEYGINDCAITAKIAEIQIQQAQDRGILPFMQTHMVDRLVTALMEMEGMVYDRDTAIDLGSGVMYELEQATKEIAKLTSHWPIEFNPASVKHVQAMLYGTPVTYVEKELMLLEGKPLVWKSGAKKGQPRYANVTLTWNIDRAAPFYNKKDISTSEGVLKQLQKAKACPEIDLLLKHRGLSKDLNNYYVGYTKLQHTDGRLHPSINHCATHTGRTSCTKPNLQNATTGEKE